MSFKSLTGKFLSVLGIKHIIKSRLFYLTNLQNKIFNFLFNNVVKNQNKDFTQIPVIIVSYNQYSYLKELINFLLEINHNKIIILDNNSTYKPLVSYLDNLNDSKIKVHRLNENLGHMVFWKTDYLFKKYATGYYVITDPDILPVKECPSDFIKRLKKELDSNFNCNKVGLSLKIDDIPDSNLNKQKIVDWEKQFWQECTKNGNYVGNIDTTFAIYRPKVRKLDGFFYKAIRMNFPYQGRHMSWYIDSNKISPEMNFLYENSNSSSSWKPNKHGELIRTIYKR